MDELDQQEIVELAVLTTIRPPTISRFVKHNFDPPSTLKTREPVTVVPLTYYPHLTIGSIDRLFCVQ